MNASELLERLKRGSIWSLVARVSASFSALLISILLARMLSVDAMGGYFLFLQILAFVSLLHKAGMRLSLQKVLGISSRNESWYEVRQYLSTASLMLLFTTVVFTVVIYHSWSWITDGLLNAPILSAFVIAMIIAVPLRSLEEIGSAIFVGLHLPQIGVFLADVPRQMFLLLFLILAYFYLDDVSLDSAIDMFLIASSSAVLIFFFLMSRWLLRHPVNEGDYRSRVDRKDFILLSIPMLLQGGAALMMSASDIWILGIYTTTEDVAIYGAVVRLTMLLVFALSVVNLVIPPMLAVLYDKNDLAGLQRLMRTSASWSVFIVLPVSFVFIVFGEEILGFAFGEAYSAGYEVFVILTVAHSINALSGSPGMLLQMSGHQQLLLRLTTVWALISITLNILVVGDHGMQGVALVTGSCIIGMNLSMVFSVYRIMGVKTYARIPMIGHIKTN